jgi:hypothetical protein
MRRAVVAVLLVVLAHVPSAGAMQMVDAAPGVKELALAPHLLESGEPWETNFMAFDGDLAVASAGFDFGTELAEDQGSRSRGFGVFRLFEGAPHMKQIAAYSCPAGIQTDIGIWGDYVFQTTNPSDVRSKTCNNTDDSVGKAGLRIVDISDPRRPKQVKFVPLRCRGPMFALNPHGRYVYIYAMRENDCAIRTGISSYKMLVVRFDPRNPRDARVVSEPSLGDGDSTLEATDQDGCFDFSVFVPRRLLACVSFTRFTLYSIEDPANPRFLGSADGFGAINSSVGGFSWDGRILIVNDQGEGAGFAANCAGEASVPDLYFFDITDPSAPRLLGSYETPRVAVAATPRRFPHCQMWDFAVIPTKDPKRRLLAGGHMSAGFTLVDFSDPAQAKEVAWHCQCDENGLSASDASHGYWYNGRFYAPEMQTLTGIRVLKVDGFDHSTVHSFDQSYNPQTYLRTFRS